MAGKAKIITNSAQLGLGLGLSLAILFYHLIQTPRLCSQKFSSNLGFLLVMVGPAYILLCVCICTCVLLEFVKENHLSSAV